MYTKSFHSRSLAEPKVIRHVSKFCKGIDIAAKLTVLLFRPNRWPRTLMRPWQRVLPLHSHNIRRNYVFQFQKVARHLWPTQIVSSPAQHYKNFHFWDMLLTHFRFLSPGEQLSEQDDTLHDYPRFIYRRRIYVSKSIPIYMFQCGSQEAKENGTTFTFVLWIIRRHVRQLVHTPYCKTL